LACPAADAGACSSEEDVLTPALQMMKKKVLLATGWALCGSKRNTVSTEASLSPFIYWTHKLIIYLFYRDMKINNIQNSFIVLPSQQTVEYTRPQFLLRSSYRLHPGCLESLEKCRKLCLCTSRLNTSCIGPGLVQSASSFPMRSAATGQLSLQQKQNRLENLVLIAPSLDRCNWSQHTRT